MFNKASKKSAKGSRREIEVSCSAWLDLLGYGSMLREAKFDPTNSLSIEAVHRMKKFHKISYNHSCRYLPVTTINDGAVTVKDLSPRSRSVTYDFVRRVLNLFNEINTHEKSSGYPGVRAIIATGFRIRTFDTERVFDNSKAKKIISKLTDQDSDPIQIVHEALSYRTSFGLYPELEANFAFTKAYLADGDGSKKGFSGPNLFIDLNLFMENIPEWITFERIIDWKKDGLSSKFGCFQALNEELAGSQMHSGILDAFDVAKNLSDSKNIIKKLKSTRIR